MRQGLQVWCFSIGVFAAGAGLCAQNAVPNPSVSTPAAAPATPAPAAAAPLPNAPAPESTVVGGRLHGVVKSGKIPLPGVTVTAQNTLTGRKYATTTDITGAWSMTIPSNGRYVVRTQFAAFAQSSQEALLNANSSHDLTLNFDLTLASRAAAAEAAQTAAQTAAQNTVQQAIRQLASSGSQSVSLMSALGGDTEAAEGGTASASSGAALPSIAGNTDFSSDSVSVNGQSGQTSALAGMDPDRLRDAIETIRAQGGGLFDNGTGFGGAFGGMFVGGGPGGGGGFGGGPGGGRGGGGGGFGGGGRGNFRGFNPGQPHGSLFWFGSNTALNAQPWSASGVPEAQPASGSNRFGITFMTAPYIPGLWKPSGKDTVFFTLSGSRTSSPSEYLENVPTADQRNGNISDTQSVNVSNQAAYLLQFIPLPNINDENYNFHQFTTAQSNATQAGVRYMRSFGANARQPGFGGRGGGGGGRRSQQNQGLRQSINGNFNWSESASDSVNPIPKLGGKSHGDSYSVQAGYTIGYKKLTNIFNANWNRSDSNTSNYFTNVEDVATEAQIYGPDGQALNTDPMNWGVPNISMGNYSGINQTQPSFSISQTISLSETLSWIHGHHNLRFGGDYRRVHRDYLGAGNATGSFIFTGAYTGSSLGDFLEGEPQQTSISAAEKKTYLRDNVFDLYAQDDWRMSNSLTLTYGLRYEFFAPYTEKYNRLAMVDTNPAGGFTNVGQVSAGETSANYGHLPDSLVYPYRIGFSPRFGLAWRVPKVKSMVVRAGYGMNYTVGEYGTFATNMAYQPPFVNEQSNVCTTAALDAAPCYTLQNGFPTPNTIGTYAVNPHYRLPHVQAYNLDIQKTLPWGMVLNVGYNGTKAGNMDVRIAPRATDSSPDTDPGDYPFYYLEDGAFYYLNAGTVRLNKRMTHGFSAGANYQWSHAIDNAGAVGGSGSAITAQNWQDIAAEKGNSSIDIRHTVSGEYVYELPFGKDKFWATAGVASHILEGFSISGQFKFATGGWLTPTLLSSSTAVSRGTNGVLRADYVQGQSITAGGGSRLKWFNTDAFAPLQAGETYGSAPRNVIPGPGTVSNDMSLSKTVQFGDMKSLEFRATASNVFNTVQYSGVNTQLPTDSSDANHFGQVTSAGPMRAFNFTSRFRF